MSPELDLETLQRVVTRAYDHDPDAWEQLYRHCRPRLYRYARRRLDSDAAADDAVSEAMVRAMTNIDSFTWRGAGFDAWMYGIARNVVSEVHRSGARAKALAQRQAIDIDLRGQSDSGNHGAAMESEQEAQTLQRAFARLSEADQEVLELRVLGGLSSDAVAEVLDKAPGTVRMAQSRALERLRQAMRQVSDV